jgi:hypothetical protein
MFNIELSMHTTWKWAICRDSLCEFCCTYCLKYSRDYIHVHRYMIWRAHYRELAANLQHFVKGKIWTSDLIWHNEVIYNIIPLLSLFIIIYNVWNLYIYIYTNLYAWIHLNIPTNLYTHVDIHEYINIYAYIGMRIKANMNQTCACIYK